MLVLEKARLVFLANPKTATQSLRGMLGPYAAATPKDTGNKHINAAVYYRRWSRRIAEQLGGVPDTFAVMREPLAHLQSWFRYRQRDALRGHENSTHGMTFADFIRALLSDDPPPFARIGRQDRFMGFLNEDVPPVTYIFDYDRLDLLTLFLSERLGADLVMPVRNVSPSLAPEDMSLPEDLMTQLRDLHAGQFALYDKVHDQGVLETREISSSGR